MLNLGVAQAGFIQVGSNQASSLRQALTNGIKHERFTAIVVPDKAAVRPGLAAYFNPNRQSAT